MKYLKNLADNSVTKCDGIVIVMDILSNSIATKKNNYYVNKLS